MTLAEWLDVHHYGEATKRGTLQALHHAQEAWRKDQPLPKSARDAMSRAVTFAEVESAEGLPTKFVAWLKAQGVKPVKKLPKEKPKQRVRKAVSLDETRWFKLHDWLEKSDIDEDYVLFVVLRSGLRIGDVLRTPVTTIGAGLKSGVLQIKRKGGTFVDVPVGDNVEAWQRLHKAATKAPWKPRNVAHFLCRENDSSLPGDCAYQRANRRIKEYQLRLKCQDSLHLHRLRRTIAVVALRETGGDLTKVMQMLGQRAISSTQRYTDELQTEGIATLQSQIFGKRGK